MAELVFSLPVPAGGFDTGGGKRSSAERAGTKLPVTMGHEIGGEVAEVGPDVQAVLVGDKVVVCPWIGCGACPVCERGDAHLCPRASNTLGIQKPGGDADMVRVPHARYLVPIGTLAPARAATFACAGITALGAICRLGAMTADDMVALKLLQIGGSYVGSLNDLRELVALAQRVTLPEIPLDLRPLAKVNEALADLAQGRVVGRVVLQT